MAEFSGMSPAAPPVPSAAVSLDELLTLHAARAYRLAHAITRDEAGAEQVVQDVLLALLRDGDALDGPESGERRVRRLTTDAALRRSRIRATTRPAPPPDLLPRFDADGHRQGDGNYLLADWSARPLGDLLQGETRVVVERALDLLPEDCRAALALREEEGLAPAEIADLLGGSVATVQGLLHLAHVALREQLTHHLAARV